MNRHMRLALVSCALLVACSDDPGEPGAGGADASHDTAGADAVGTDVADDSGADVVEPTPDTTADALPDAPEVTYPDDPPDVVGGDRPAQVLRPTTYDPDQAWPLVVLLHGFGASGLLEDAGDKGKTDRKSVV